jgi:hypothetical protein
MTRLARSYLLPTQHLRMIAHVHPTVAAVSLLLKASPRQPRPASQPQIPNPKGPANMKENLSSPNKKIGLMRRPMARF